jgi:hypothetical protein
MEKKELITAIKEIVCKHEGISSGEMNLDCDIVCESMGDGMVVSLIVDYRPCTVLCEVYVKDGWCGDYAFEYEKIDEATLEEIYETLKQYDNEQSN